MNAEKETFSMNRARKGPRTSKKKEGLKFSVHPNPLEIPRLIMEREARKKKEYAERAKMDVK